MKFLVLFAPTVLALVERQGAVIGDDVSNIVTNVGALQTAVNNFQGAAQADGLIAASEGVVAAIQKGTADAKVSPQLTDDDALLIVQPLSDLIDIVNQTITTLISKKDVFAASGRGCEVLPQLVSQKAATQAFSDIIVDKVPDDLKIIAPQISLPILNSLSAGITAFQDVQCAATSTTSTQVSTTSSTPSSSSDATTAATTSEAQTTMASSSQAATTTESNASSGTKSDTTSRSATGTKTTGTAVPPTTEPCTTESGAEASHSATATGTEPCDVSITTEVQVTETVPCTTGESGPHPTSGSGSTPTQGSGCKECASGESSTEVASQPTTLVPVASGSAGEVGSPSPSSPVIAGASRGMVSLTVAMAAIVGAVGVAL